MTIIKLAPKRAFKAPVNAQTITPDAFQEKTISEIAELHVWEGNRRRKLGELFHISEEKTAGSESLRIEVSGDLRKVRWIGAKMTTGEIIINGDVGMHLGEEMEGGKITVNGNAEAWLGSMMHGGTIEVKGNAGDYVASAYRGSTRGMNGGKIIIHGNVGNDAGNAMRKGVIIVHGNAGQFAGVNMQWRYPNQRKLRRKNGRRHAWRKNSRLRTREIRATVLHHRSDKKTREIRR